MAHVETQTSLQASARPSPIRIRKLGHIVIQVRNLERSVRFYTELGGHTSVEFLDPDGYHLEVYCDMDQLGPNDRSRPRNANATFDTLEKARDNPKPPTW